MEFIADNSGIVAMMLFLTTFVLVMVWAYLPANKNRLDAHAMIPLEEPNND